MSPMISHTTLGTNDLARARAFYDPAMAALGYRLVRDEEESAAYGPDERHPIFWVMRPYDGKPATAGNGTHIALLAPTREAVDAFHAACLTNGGRDEGAPGLRSYAANYYAAYVRDPDGNKLQAVCYAPE